MPVWETLRKEVSPIFLISLDFGYQNPMLVIPVDRISAFFKNIHILNHAKFANQELIYK